jgi:site-specific DNA-methyltransferase (adenine-specific)
VELRDLESYGEPGTVVYLADCLQFMPLMPPESVDVVFADPSLMTPSGPALPKGGFRLSL